MWIKRWWQYFVTKALSEGNSWNDWREGERERECEHWEKKQKNNNNNQHDPSKQERNLVSAYERYTMQILYWFG